MLVKNISNLCRSYRVYLHQSDTWKLAIGITEPRLTSVQTRLQRAFLLMTFIHLTGHIHHKLECVPSYELPTRGPVARSVLFCVLIRSKSVWTASYQSLEGVCQFQLDRIKATSHAFQKS